MPDIVLIFKFLLSEIFNTFAVKSAIELLK